MAKCIRYVGLDVHADTIAVAMAEGNRGEVRSLGTVRNRPEAVRRLVKKLEPVSTVRACYEARPTTTGGDEGVDGQVLELARHGEVRVRGPGGHPPGLPDGGGAGG